MTPNKILSKGSTSTNRCLRLAWALLALSLALPVGYGAEIFGIIRGWMFVLIPPLTLLYVPVPISLLLARRKPVAAAVLSILSCFGWGYVLATQGLFIDAFLSDRQLFASGVLCALAASVLAAYVSLSEVGRRGQTLN